MKKNLKSGTKVRIVNTNSPNLDGQVCEIIGKSHTHIIDTYILLLERPIEQLFTYDETPFLHKAIALTEACIEVV